MGCDGEEQNRCQESGGERGSRRDSHDDRDRGAREEASARRRMGAHRRRRRDPRRRSSATVTRSIRSRSGRASCATSSTRSPATTFLGMTHRMPVLLAPIASLSDVHPEGALPVARAAESVRLSHARQQRHEAELRGRRAASRASSSPCSSTPTATRSGVVDVAKRAEQAGAKALCVTVDVPTFGRRERHIHRRAAMAGRPFGALRVGEMHRCARRVEAHREAQARRRRCR